MKRALLAGPAVALLLTAVNASASSSVLPASERQTVQPQGVILLAQADPDAEQLLPRKKKRAQQKGAAKQNQAAPARKPQAEAAQPRVQKQRKAVAQQEPASKPRAKAPKPESQAAELPRKKQKKAVAQQKPAPKPRIKAPKPEPKAAELPRKKQKKAVAQQEQAPKPRIKAPKPEPRAAELPRKKQKAVAQQKPSPKAGTKAPKPEPRAAELPRKKEKKAVAQQEPAAKPRIEKTPQSPLQAEELQPRGKKKKAVAQQKPAPRPGREAPTSTARQQVAPEVASPGQQAEEAPGMAPAARGAKDRRKLRSGTVAAAPAEELVPRDPKAARERPEKAAPVFDSAKEEPAAPGDKTASIKRVKRVRPAAPPPVDDRAAQQAAPLVEIQAVTAEQGERIAEPPPPIVQRRPRGVDVVREIGDRVVVGIGNTIIVESSDRPRITRDAREVYYEELPRNRTREVVVREDGTQVITVRNRYGDIVRRSRIVPGGREYVLVYVDDRDYERLDDWRDPGLDLPPLVLTVPMSEYVLDADDVEDPDVYYEFLERPPVEPVERLYSVDEVKRSARIRDKVPRIELDTITFDFGSTAIGEDQVPKLEGVAQAMERLLQKNPGESFLIEGHTDLVGSDVANLALSDRRAESVAAALANVFAIPPENLATQGYGERYPKVNIEEQEPLNRRVVIRRITPLVAPAAPVASAN
jgi:outer membrane protein OmpA-like peptidoglycan-associated protein